MLQLVAAQRQNRLRDYFSRAILGQRLFIEVPNHERTGRSARGLADIYCVRGEREKPNPGTTLGLLADRTSGHQPWANQYRRLLAALGHLLIESLYRLGLAGTEPIRAQCAAVRVGLPNQGRVALRFCLSDAYPWQDRYWQMAERFASG